MGSWGWGPGPQRLFWGLRNQVFSAEALVQLLDYSLGNAVTSLEYVKGQCCDTPTLYHGQWYDSPWFSAHCEELWKELWHFEFDKAFVGAKLVLDLAKAR